MPGARWGLAIMREFEASTSFEHDLAEAKAEVQATLEISRRPAPTPKPAPLSATSAQ